MTEASSSEISTTDTPAAWTKLRATAVLVLANGATIYGRGLGAVGEAVGEVCFNTAMTGYQEILTDPSYAGQIITFTFPHIGNVGVNDEDTESTNPASVSGVRGAILRAEVTEPSNYRAAGQLGQWMANRGIIGLCGLDTRALTRLIRESGMPNAVIAHDPDGSFDLARLAHDAAQWPGIEGAELAAEVTCGQSHSWDLTPWVWDKGFGRRAVDKRHVVVVDYGAKSNILRSLAGLDCAVSVVPATASADDILARKPDGVFLTNGPGDPAMTGEYAIPEIRKLIETGIPIAGICLGHQILALALGAQTTKMHQGHHGANHPVVDLTTGKVEITSMNHGFTVDSKSLPDGVTETHRSLFDGTNCGIAVAGQPIFSVQYHPEASPGPQDSFYLFQRFVDLIDARMKG